MGVYIYFSAEVRKENKWVPIVWKNSFDQKSHYKIWGGRSYHYDDALEDIHYIGGYPADMSEELRALLPDKDAWVTRGYFSFIDLESYLYDAEKKMMINIMQSRDFQLIKHINRIEKTVLQKPVKDKINTSYLSDYSMKQIYEDYKDEVFPWIKIREIVYYLADEFSRFPNENDIRIIFYMA